MIALCYQTGATSLATVDQICRIYVTFRNILYIIVISMSSKRTRQILFY